ncbi:hypothetical protein LX36DRAFT_326578 [Colletotrichum falcatum]|nr:hypothetical protein LX36DRAFT_326578 [Colletotrichum falcatum]
MKVREKKHVEILNSRYISLVGRAHLFPGIPLKLSPMHSLIYEKRWHVWVGRNLVLLLARLGFLLPMLGRGLL